MRHEFEQVHVHPTALMMGADMGLSTKDMKGIISRFAEANPMGLIGGYNIDIPIIALAATLRLEDILDGEEEDKLIQNVIETYSSITGAI